jgi:hypothetical protein
MRRAAKSRPAAALDVTEAAEALLQAIFVPIHGRVSLQS